MPSTSISAAAPAGRAQAERLARPRQKARAAAQGVLGALVAVLPAYAVSRAVLVSAAALANAFAGYARPQDGLHPPLVQGLLSWDAVHFLAVARHGYPAAPGAVEQGFLPGFPALLALLGASDAAAVAAGAALGLAALAVLRALAMELDPAVAGTATWVAAFSPAAFYWSAVYSEALFAVLGFGALLAARRGRPALAGLLGAGAALTRLPGIALAAPIALFLDGRARAWALAPVAALGSWMAWLWWRTGDPLAYVHSQAANHPLGGARGVLNLLAGRPEEIVGLAALIAVVGALVLALGPGGPLSRQRPGRERAALWLLVAGLLAPAAAAGTLGSLARYAMVAPPIAWGAARAPRALLLGLGVPAAVAYTVFSASGRLTP